MNSKATAEKGRREKNPTFLSGNAFRDCRVRRVDPEQFSMQSVGEN